MFELTLEEHKALIINMRSQFVTTSNNPNTHTRYAPFAFTEQGVAMLSSVLKSDIAIQVNIAIMRAFVQVREHLLTTTSLSAELKELRAKVDLIQCQQEEDLGALNDLSEEVRKDIDNLYVAIGQLAARLEEKKERATETHRLLIIRSEANRENARKMLLEGISVEVIGRVTGLSAEEIDYLK